MKASNQTLEKLKLEALKEAIHIAGGQSALAKRCGNGIKQQHIYNWLYRNKGVPPHRILLVEKAVDGKVSRQRLGPDIYPADD